ncbi:MAG: baseplate J/gp47 family protein, partial [Lewinella sp.]|nr:baseplate J/gp47 family protein [Lewinella sp.]
PADLPRHDWPLLCLEWLKTPPGYFKQAHITVQAKGLKNLIAQNNEGKVDADAAFLPFGAEPMVGNHLKLTHPEIINKPLDTISIKFDWSDDDLNSREELQTYFDPLLTVAEGMQGDGQINIEQKEIGQVNLVFHEPSGLEDIFHETSETKEAAVDASEGSEAEHPSLNAAEGSETTKFYITEQLEEAKVRTPLSRNKDALLDLDTDWNELSIDAVAHIKLELQGEGVLFEYYERLQDELALQKQRIKDRLSDGPKADELPPKSKVTVTEGTNVKEYTVDYELEKGPAKGATTQTAEAAIDPDSLPDSLPDPFIPEIKQAYLSYTAHLDTEDKYAHTWIDFYTLHPFGYEAFELEPPNEKVVWEPPLAPSYDEPGALYIGLDKVSPPQDISILFEMLEGTAIPEAPAVRLKWEYLKANDRWAAPSGGAPPVHLRLHDDTQQLTHAGTINFAIPADATLDSQLLPKGLAWLRVSILPEALIPYPNELITGAICHLRSIHAQTVVAQLRDDKYADTHYRQPLPPDSVEAFAEPAPEIVDIQQFYPSFRGRPTELPGDFQLRASERLRHKNRALSPWDYERLVLEHFPQVYKTKCLPTVERAGEVTVVVIPDRNYAKPHDPLYPKASREELADIKAMLAQHAPPFANLKVVNPHYETLQVEFQVKFVEGTAQGHALRQLREDLVRYLSPWAFDPVADVELDKTIYRGAVTQYIQQLPYVEFLAKLDLFRLDARGKPEGPFAELVARRPDTVWVSDREHPIYVLQGEMPQEGIGVMSVDFDFKVFPRKKGK